MPCPHYDIRIVQRSENESAIAAAYQNGDKLFSEYDQEQKYYSHKSEIVHKEIMLPPHAPPEYADRNTLWNAAEAVEKQSNSQLARRVILAIPRELSLKQGVYTQEDYKEFSRIEDFLSQAGFSRKRNFILTASPFPCKQIRRSRLPRKQKPFIMQSMRELPAEQMTQTAFLTTSPAAQPQNTAKW